ncbi:ATP synthase mitochondrial F1 complex assembly factor 1 [Onthophagus taurus]|uniref:ATP synthase mitochondrial F1 complex assembly factor 1 n=1 Tax=Onthophagus taurus TaxID=166361 RepID=UPI000C203730|nr:ATP synthase mitochondrial F1 complex assembly factor 1 [Onthophagus taurus]
MNFSLTRKFAVRILHNCVFRKSILSRNIMNTSAALQKANEELEDNPYYKKYADKIAKLQQTSPEEFLNRIEKRKDVKEAEKPKEKQFSSLLQPKKTISESKQVENEPLDKIMKVDLIKDKTADEIKTIWEAYHIQKDVIAATIPTKDFNTIIEESKNCPIFLFPIPRSQGFEFIMCEFQGNSVHFTPLICYQVHKENSPECLTINHYTEFKDEKGIVLMRGEYDKNVITGKEAQCLANQLQLYYDKRDPEKSKLLKIFSQNPDEFKHTDLIKQIENISLG